MKSNLGCGNLNSANSTGFQPVEIAPLLCALVKEYPFWDLFSSLVPLQTGEDNKEEAHIEDKIVNFNDLCQYHETALYKNFVDPIIDVANKYREKVNPHMFIRFEL